MAGSGILDVERRLEDAALELLSAFAPLTDIVGTAVVVKRDADTLATYPAAYVEAYNLAEYGAHTGNYLGGVRLGSVTYADDDKDRDVCKQILGAVRAWAQQEDVVTQLNNTTSAQTFLSRLWVFALEMDMFGTGGSPATLNDTAIFERANIAMLELTVVCAPTRP